MVFLVVVALSLQVLAVEDIGIETPSRLTALATKISSSQGRRNLDFVNEVETAYVTAEKAVDASLTEPVIDLDVSNEETAGNSTRADGEGRRILWSCKFHDYNGHYSFKIKSVKIKAGANGDPFCVYNQNTRFRTQETKLFVRMEIEDDDTSCPGCVEQIHVGLVDDQGFPHYNPQWKPNHQCVQLGGGNFGRRTLEFEFSAQRWARAVNVYVTGGWQYKCKGDEDIFNLWRYMPTHWRKHKIVRIELQ